MIKGIITPEERDCINVARAELLNKNRVEVLENLVLKIKIIQLGKLSAKLNNVINNPKEESNG